LQRKFERYRYALDQCFPNVLNLEPTLVTIFCGTPIKYCGQMKAKKILILERNKILTHMQITVNGILALY